MTQTIRENEDIRTTTPAGKSLKLSISATLAKEAGIGKYFTHRIYTLENGKKPVRGILIMPLKIKR